MYLTVKNLFLEMNLKPPGGIAGLRYPTLHQNTENTDNDARVQFSGAISKLIKVKYKGHHIIGGSMQLISQKSW